MDMKYRVWIFEQFYAGFQIRLRILNYLGLFVSSVYGFSREWKRKYRIKKEKKARSYCVGLIKTKTCHIVFHLDVCHYMGFGYRYDYFFSDIR